MKPEIIKLDSKNITAVKKAAEVLRSGGIVVHPTDTCYGIAADIFNPEAVKKVYLFKGRDYHKPFNIIVRDFEQMKEYGHWNPLIKKIVDENQKKMFSFVLPKKRLIPSHFNPDFKTIGIQIPKFNFSLSLLNLVDFPLVATSANLSTMRNVYSFNSLMKQIKKAEILPDLIIDGGRLSLKKPSSVVEIKDGKINYLRR
ncbi:threonylcarbamoyl-AMP synthase [Patescibacteria group bacterium]|nr:threonylcarbamoyl-AMP synthase [Patescibacteria group bacterium]